MSFEKLRFLYLFSFRRYVSVTSSTCLANSTLLNTYKKVFNFSQNDLDSNRRISRHDFVSLSQNLKTQVEKVDKIEAFFVHAAFMNLANIYKLEKFPEDGGNEYTLEQLCNVLESLPTEVISLNATILQRALFRAIDTNCNGYISKEEWISYLKLRNLYIDDAQALRLFDELDTNKDGRISRAEYEASSEKFWKTKGTEEENFYGTAS